MSEVLKGKAVADEIKAKVKAEVSSLRERGITPTVGIVRMGSRPDDIAYERGILKNCQSVDIESKVYEVDVNTPMDEFVKLIEEINEDKNVHGILIFRPLPQQIDEEKIRHIINPDKDIDCMSPLNLEKVFEGDMSGFVPCTPKAVVEILKHYNVPLVGANVAVVNSSLVVGRPLSMMLLGEKATPTICHSKTKDLQSITAKSDVVVTAVGRSKMFNEGYFSSNNVVIDVGINDDGNGGICGDVDYDNVLEKVKAITPVPGGVGSVTTSILLHHVVVACKKAN